MKLGGLSDLGGFAYGFAALALLSLFYWLVPDGAARRAFGIALCACTGLLVFLFRTQILSLFGLRIRQKPSAAYLAAAFVPVAAALATFLSSQAALAMKKAFALVYPATSDAKVYVFFGFFAAAFLAKAFLEARGGAKTSLRLPAAIFFALLGLLLAANTLSSLLLSSSFEGYAAQQGLEFKPLSAYYLGIVYYTGQGFFGFIESHTRINVSHVLKAAASLPMLLANPSWAYVYDLGFVFLQHVPFPIMFLFFCLAALACLAALLLLCNFEGAEFLLLSFAAFVAIAGAIHSGIFSEFVAGSMIALSLALEKKLKSPRFGLVAVFFILLFANTLHVSNRDFGMAFLQAIFVFAAFVCAREKLAALSALALLASVAAGGLGTEAIVAFVLGAIACAAAFKGFGTKHIVLCSLAFMFATSWAWPPNAALLLVSLYSLAAIFGYFASGRQEKLFLVAVMALIAFIVVPLYLNIGYDLFQFGYKGANIGFLADSSHAQVHFDSSYFPKYDNLGQGREFVSFENFTSENLEDASASKSLPKIYQSYYVCVSFSQNDSIKYLAVLDVSCTSATGAKNATLVLKNSSTSISFEFVPQGEKCAVVAQAKGTFARCPELVIAAIQNVANVSNVTAEYSVVDRTAQLVTGG